MQKNVNMHVCLDLMNDHTATRFHYWFGEMSRGGITRFLKFRDRLQLSIFIQEL